MDKSLLRYIWRHTRRQQLFILAIVAASMVPYFLAFDLPKQIINGPIQGGGFESEGATQAYMDFAVTLPWLGTIFQFDGIPLDRLETLGALSGVFLLLVIVNGLFKYYINTYKGRLGERLLRRIRYQLVDRILRFPPSYLKKVHAAEVSSMVKDEVEPFGGFTGDAFVQPAMLGGQAIAALFFIMVQNFWLGMIAATMVAIQVGIIPKMRHRLIELGRQRQVTARHFAGKVSEIVEGISTIHAFDTSNYERADVSHRLGHIYKIRYDLYQWKFLVKFVNNFLSQLTPFLFYSIGGYLTLRGSLDVGQLIAVINAYKDLPGPLKELIDWDQARQDVQVKYEQVLEEFEAPMLIPPAVHTLAAKSEDKSFSPLAAVNVTIEDQSGARVAEGVSVKFERGETVAIIDNAGSGAEALAEAFGRVAWPVAGKITLQETDLLDLPESVSGRAISYSGADSYFFHGTLKDNLLYGLKHAPTSTVTYSGRDATQRRWEMHEARMAGNADFDIHAEWLDRSTTSVRNGQKDDLKNSLLAALDAVQLTSDIMDLALHSTFDPEVHTELAARIVDMRHALRSTLAAKGLSHLVVFFEPDRYNIEASVGENLLFGTMRQGASNENSLLDSDYFYDVLRSAALLEPLFDMGAAIAENLVDIFGSLPEDHPFFQQMIMLSADEIDVYEQLLLRFKERPEGVRPNRDELRAMLRLSFNYVELRYRFGLLTPELSEKIVKARDLLHDKLPAHLTGLIERYDPHRYIALASLRENILFGKLSHRIADAGEQIRAVASGVMHEKDLYASFLGVGLEFDIGAGGRRLTLVQRQKLNVARSLIRRSDFYVFNRALPGLDRRVQNEIVKNVVDFLKEQDHDPAIIWVLSNTSLARLFKRVVVFDRGSIADDGTFETLEQESGIFKTLVA